MKKILLLLSCFLATWCSVQAASPSGKINSASYNASNSTISANFTTNYASKAKLGLMSTSKGNSMYSPLSPQTYSVPNRYGYTSSSTLNVDPTLEECQFYVFLYLNGSSSPCSAQQVNVIAKGSIKNVAVSHENETFTVNYSMQHGSTYYSSIRIYDDAGTTELYKENIKKTDSNPNTNVNTYRNASLSYSSLNSKLEGGKYYRCRLYTNEKKLAEYRFYWPELPDGGGNGGTPTTVWYSGIKKITPMGNNKIKVDFTVKDAGVNVELKATAVSGAPVAGGTTTYNYGYCEGHEGSCEISLPYLPGVQFYAVELFVNGQSVNGATIGTLPTR